MRVKQRKPGISAIVSPVVRALTAAAALALPSLALAQMSHDHQQQNACTEAALACASKATPAFAPDGSLWVVFATATQTMVVQSPDLGRTFSAPVAVHDQPWSLDWGPDARPQIAIDGSGRIVVAFNTFRDRAFNGEIFYTRSTDGGRSFAAAKPITANAESQRFQAIALDADGALFAAWLDKRNRVPAMARGEKYVGAALAFAWSRDGGGSFSETHIAQDNTCECCRLGIAFAGPGRPVVVFRNVFDKTTRDHAVMTFDHAGKPGPIRRVSIDDWKTDACPHQGPSITIGKDGSYHVAWYTNGQARRGVFYARSSDGGLTFSDPVPIGAGHSASRPYLLATAGAVWVTWKEFTGQETVVMSMTSHDDGRTWAEPQAIARTAHTSDHPLLIASGGAVFLSWMTRAEGYRFQKLEDRL